MSTKPVFEKIAKIQRSLCPTTWTYDICAFDTGTHYDYYWQNHDIWCKQNKHFRPISGNKYSTLHVIKSNVGVGIKSTSGLKTFMGEWNGQLRIHSSFNHQSPIINHQSSW